MCIEGRRNLGEDIDSKSKKQLLTLTWGVPSHSVMRSLQNVDTITAITFAFLGFLIMLIILCVLYLRRVENTLSRDEERRRIAQEMADAEIERVRRESILGVLPSKV